MDQASIDYGVMMGNLINILENYEDSLNKMKIVFMHMAHYAKFKVYTDIVQSEEYRTVDSVGNFFELLAPYLKTPDCSLLKALVHATQCEGAMQILQEFLDKSSNVVLEHSCISPPDNVPESESDNESVITSEPIADSNTVPIKARMSVDEMSWGMLRHAQSFLCGLLRVPQSALLYKNNGSGSVIIKWTTSKKIAVHMQSVVLDDGDMELLLQERIVSVQVGLNYKISVGNQEYWRVSHCMGVHGNHIKPMHKTSTRLISDNILTANISHLYL